MQTRIWITLGSLTLLASQSAVALLCPPINRSEVWIKSVVIDAVFGRRVSETLQNVLECTRQQPALNRCSQRVLEHLQISKELDQKPYRELIQTPEFQSRTRQTVQLQSLPTIITDPVFLSTLTSPVLWNSQSFLGVKTYLGQVNHDLPEAAQIRAVAYEPSRFVMAVDDTPHEGRLLFFIPKEYFVHENQTQGTSHLPRDLYVQVNLPDNKTLLLGGHPTAELPSHQFSVVSVHPCPDDPSLSCTDIIDLWRHQLPEGGFRVDLPPSHALKANSQKCYECHVNGPIRIETKNIPFEYPAPGVHQWIHERMAGEIHDPFVQMQHPVRLGVTPDETVTEDDFNWCIDEDFEDVNPKILRKAMNCASCHGAGKPRPPLPVPPFLSESFLDSYISSGRMPPHAKLNKEERTALGECLLYVARAKLQRYLLEFPCPDLSTVASCVPQSIGVGATLGTPSPPGTPQYQSILDALH